MYYKETSENTCEKGHGTAREQSSRRESDASGGMQNGSTCGWDNNTLHYTINREKITGTPGISSRTDGRDTNQERSISVASGNEGMLLRKYLSLGKNIFYSSAAMIYCAVEIKRPQQEKPKQGTLTIHCNEKYIQQELDKIFNRSKILPLETLSIIPKVAVISIKLDISVFHDKGGILEILTEGIYKTLMGITVEEEIYHQNKPHRISKSIKDLVQFYPTTVSCAVVNGNCLYDPTEEESQAASARMVITHTKNIGGETNKDRTGDILYWSFSGSMRYRDLQSTLKDALCIK
ncbi:hypothetical protein NEAUS04_1978 [Nematocida ausubeli]|nr:hypothetical protein NEAUS04_1978 [Nematocida ausubeli]